MGTIMVDVNVLVNDEFVTMFRNVKIDVEETSNRKMNQAFEEQHPRLYRKIPRHTEIWNGLGSTVEYVSYFICKPNYDTFNEDEVFDPVHRKFINTAMPEKMRKMKFVKIR